MAARKYSSEEVTAAINALRLKARSKVIKRNKRLTRSAKLAALATFIIFVLAALNTNLDLHATFERYHNLCASTKSGHPLEAMRGLASESHLFFEQDPDRHPADDPIYVLRPSADWPYILGCRFTAHEAELFPLRR